MWKIGRCLSKNYDAAHLRAVVPTSPLSALASFLVLFCAPRLPTFLFAQPVNLPDPGRLSVALSPLFRFRSSLPCSFLKNSRGTSHVSHPCPRFSGAVLRPLPSPAASAAHLPQHAIRASTLVSGDPPPCHLPRCHLLVLHSVSSYTSPNAIRSAFLAALPSPLDPQTRYFLTHRSHQPHPKRQPSTPPALPLHITSSNTKPPRLRRHAQHRHHHLAHQGRLAAEREVRPGLDGALFGVEPVQTPC